jgi:hypothetical protein
MRLGEIEHFALKLTLRGDSLCLQWLLEAIKSTCMGRDMWIAESM